MNDLRTRTSPAGRPTSTMLRLVMTCALAATLVAPAAAVAGAIDDRVQRHVDDAVVDGLGPADFHHLLFAFTWRETFSDWLLAERALDRLAAARPIDPLMADEVRLLRARLEVERGRDAAARELFRAMGGLVWWWFSGPISLEELQDFDRAAMLPSAATEWREVPGTDPLGWVSLSGLAWPPQRQMAYLATTIESDRDQPVAVRLGAAQVARAWLNGAEVLTTSQPLEMAEDQVSAGGWLRAGRNTLIVAVGAEDERWTLRVRLSRPDGRPLDNVREVREAPAVPATEVSERAAPEIRELEGEIRGEIDRGTPAARVALAAYVVAHRPRPAGAGGIRTACRAARVESPAQARLLEWLVTSDPRTSRDLLSEALRDDPALVWARVELAEWYAERGLIQQARALLDEVADREATIDISRLQIDGLLWGELVLPEMADVARAAPRCVRANLAFAEAAVAARRWELAAEALTRLGRITPGLQAVIDGRQSLAEACGDGESLRELFQQRLDHDPNRPQTRVRLARLVAADGDLDGARDVLRAGLARSPTNVDLLMELARTVHAAGDEDLALAIARDVLEIRPQDQRAQRLIELLGGAAEDRSWLRGPDELWALADRVERSTPAVVVLDHREIEFLPSNLTEERVQRAYLITDSSRAGDLLVHHVGFVPETDRLRVLKARILRRDGSEVSARRGDTPRLSEPEFNIFYDTRLRVLRFQEFEDGDLVEISYIKTETDESNETGPYNGGLLYLGRDLATAVLEVELIAAEDRMPEWEVVHLDGEPLIESTENGVQHVRWQWRNVPAVPAEVPPPPPLLVTPHLVYSNHPEWGELADWYLRHVAPRIKVSPQVEETAQRLLEGAQDRQDRIARLYRYVTNEIRYVGLEFGEHRFRPFSADWVIHHRIGDCKDKAALLVALLDVAGIPARMVMVRIFDLGPIASELAVLELFNHAIVYLPEDDLWLDGTASGHALSPPPSQDQGAFVLVADGFESAPQTTPLVGAGVLRTDSTLEKTDDGEVRITIRTEDSGEGADMRRARFAGSRESQRFARWLQEQFPGAELVGEPKLQMMPSRDPAVIEIEGRVADSVLASSGGIELYPGTIEWSTRMVPTGDRSGPLMVANRPDVEWSLTVDLGRPPSEMIDDIALETEYGTLRVEFQERAAGYRVDGSLRVAAGLVEAHEASGLREFLVAVERTLQRRLEAP